MKRMLFVLFSILLGLNVSLLAQANYPPSKEDPVLQQKLSDLIKDFHGQTGIYVHQFSTGRTAAINADTLFPTASMIKVSIMLKLFDRIDKGELKYDSVLVYRDSLNSFGDGGICGSLKDSTRIPFAEVVMLMMTMSDNVAALWCQSLADSGQAINQWLEVHGFHNTRVNSRTPGRHGDWEKYGWGQTTPREMCGLFTMIHDGKTARPAASEEMFRVLSRDYWDKMALGEIPPDVHVAAKDGAVDASKSETVFVSAPSGDYVFCAITNHQQDQRWASDNEGYVLMRNVSRLLWNYFEPTSKWKPADGMEKYWK
ncbi:MAG: serine hydrolase [Bacteroidota bacterium]|nr:serine hydrolase [Bacteroidota bacterium]